MVSTVSILGFAGVALAQILSAHFSHEPKYHRCIEGYSQCMSSTQSEERCNKILNLCKQPKKKKKKDKHE
jgi:hypothetical protein